MAAVSVRLENRIRKIAEAMEANNKKAALKLGQALIKEFPGAPLAKVTWGDVLFYTDKVNEARQIAQELIDQDDLGDDQIAFTRLGMLLSNLGRGEEIVTVCKKRWEKYKDSKNIKMAKIYGRELFSAYVRKGNFEEQKKLAFLMHQKFKDPQYRSWGVVSQAFLARQPNSPPMMKTLALKMFEKHLDESPEPTLQECMFYVDLLVDQNETAKAIEFLDSDRAKGAYKIGRHRLQKIAELQSRIGEHEKAYSIYHELLTTETINEDWAWYLGLIESAFTSGRELRELNESISSVFVHIRTIPDLPTLRGVSLAELEWNLRMHEKDPSVSMENLLDQAVAYAVSFGTKGSCFRELKPTLSKILDKGLSQEFSDALKKAPIPSSLSEVDEVYYQCTLAKIFYGLKISQNSRQSALELVEKYVKYRDVSKAAMREKTDRGAGDDLLLLAVHYLLDETESLSKTGVSSSDTSSTSGNASSNTAFLTYGEALAILEIGLKDSPYNFSFKLILIRLLCATGSVHRAYEIFESLELRHIQFDTLSHFVLDDLFRYCAHPESVKLVREILSFHKHEADVKVPQKVVDAYYHGAFAMIHDFMRFREKLQNSITPVVAQLESVWLGLFNGGKSQEELRSQFTFGTIPLVAVSEDTANLTLNQDWRVIEHFNLTLTGEKKSVGFPWPSLLPFANATSAFSVPSDGSLIEGGIQRQLLHRRAYCLRAFHEIVLGNRHVADDLDKASEKLNLSAPKNDEDAPNDALLPLTLALTKFFLDISISSEALMNALALATLKVKVSVPTAFAQENDNGISGMTADQVSFDFKPALSGETEKDSASSVTVEDYLKADRSIRASSKLPSLRAMLEAMEIVVFSLLNVLSAFPKRVPKKATEVMKTQKALFKGLLSLLSRLYNLTSACVESMNHQESVFGDVGNSPFSTLFPTDSWSNAVDLIEKNALASRRVCCKRLVDHTNARLRFLQTVKL